MKESEFTKVNPLVRDASLWSAEDGEGAELEVSEFIGALVRLLKPKFVVETGCYKGQTTREIARALQENGHGYLYSCDTDQERVLAVRKTVSPQWGAVASAPGVAGV